MNYIKKILFPTDFSETAQNAFIHCLILAKKLGAEVALLHVIYPEYEAMDLPVMAAKATKDKVEAARIALQSFRDFSVAMLQKKHGVSALPEVRTDVEIGGAAGVIATVVRRDEIDLVVMGTKGQHNALERAFGSVTTGVVERVDVPVLVVPEEAEYHRVAIAAYATDFEDADPVYLWAAGHLLETYHPILHVVHIDTGDRPGRKAGFAAIEELFAVRSPALQVRFHNIREDSVEEGLAEFVENNAVDLLIMFAPRHTLLDRIFQRSYTRRMALKTHVPLLLVKEGKKR